ncbi:MAG: hypothetical protein II180_05725 [Proteobacteria bacterium]|nr:hypothetical protein [Pseudomonadota bacterium]
MKKTLCILSILASSGLLFACSSDSGSTPVNKKDCPAGQVYNEEAGACEAAPDPKPVCPETCPEGEACDTESGECKPVPSEDPCAKVNCDHGKSCLVISGQGTCIEDACIDNGSVKDCGAGKICAGGECVDDGCQDKTCAAEETCVAGMCRETACLDKTCNDGETCKGGKCIENICLDMTCNDGTVCAGGKCVLEACVGVDCKQGKVCQADGACKFDSDPALIISVANDDKNTDEQGKTASISVALNHEPASDVTITFQISDDTEAKAVCDGDACKLVFTPANWNQPQSITLAGLPDGIVDGNQTYAITFTAASDDAEFNGLSASVDDLVNIDTDKAHVIVSYPEGSMTTEAGGTVIIELTLSAKPSADVTFTVGSSDTTEAVVDVETITFTPDDWDQPHKVTVTGQNDDEKESAEQTTYQIVFGQTQSEDKDFNGLTIQPIQLINIDDDKAGVTLSATAIEVDESDTKSVIGIVLNSKPAADVTIKATSNKPEEATVETDTLVFTPENWNTPQSFTVIGVQDYKVDGDQSFTISFNFSSSDETYVFDAVTLLGTCHDTTVVGANAIAETTTVTENGSEAKVDVSLIAIPEKEVTITVAIEDDTEIAIADENMRTLTFNAENWNKPQTIVLKGVDDNIIDGNITSKVTFTSASEDAHFNGLQITPIEFVTEDNDSAKIVTEGAPASLKEELGEHATFSVFLSAEPASNVTITTRSADASELILINNIPLTFTPQNWNKPQEVQVESVDDLLSDGNIDTYIILEATSEDANFNGLSAESPIYTIVDNETANIVTSPSSLTLTPDATTGTVNISLSSAPVEPVTITFESSRPTVAEIVQTSLTFTKDNWDQPQPITIQIAGYEEAKSVVDVKVKSASDSKVYNDLEREIKVTVVAFDHQTFAYTGNPESVVLVPGVYQFEAWGASGGGTIDEGVFHETPTGLGGYAAGKLTIEKPTTVYIYVGGQGANAVLNKASVAGGWNGGGTGSWDTSDNEAAGGGGGATDFRLVGGDWNSFDSLKSRIMVAGAGGGQCSNFYWHTNGNVHAGYGGGLSGYSYTNLYAAGTQTSGHAFGYGKDGVSKCEGTLGIGGGGGGYYGGETIWTGYAYATCSGAGGSGFISGHTGCNAIKETSTAGSIEHTGTPNHYSGLVFTETVMKSGNESMPTHNGSTETGHRGNGIAKIQRLSD